MTAIADYFAVEPIIVEHIKASVKNLEDVDTPFDIENMLDSVSVTPSVSVIYYGDRMGDSTSNGKITTQYQQWLIVLKVHDAEAQSKNTNDLRAYANPFILQLLSCMQGFDPFQSTHPCGVRTAKSVIHRRRYRFNPRTRVGCEKKHPVR